MAATGGISGAVGLASVLVTASARIVPAFACGQASVMLSKARSMWPPISAFITSPELRYGTCTILVPVRSWNSSDAICVEVPAPEEP